MTNSDKLQKLIERAIENGWQDNNWTTIRWLPEDYPKNIAEAAFGMHRVNELIFNHDFAKVLWSEEPHYIHGGYFHEKDWHKDNVPMPINYSHWQYHLQQMVIADDPIDYIYCAVFQGKPVYPKDDPHE